MVVWAELGAVILYLGPLLLFCVARFSTDRRAWAIALDLPLVVAIDLLGILILTRLVRLEVAVLFSRPIWIAACALVIRRRRKRADPVRWPNALGYRTMAMVAIAAFAATYLSRILSRGFTIWDRYMHIPMVASLRGQSLPFRHVLQSSDVLHYHFSGDVLAAELQTLSFDVINAALALSLAHDILFAATAVSAALLFRDFGLRRGAPCVAASIGLLLLGPLVFLRDGVGAPFNGYSYHAFLTVSFRPHVVLAGLLFVGIAGSIAARLFAPDRRKGIALHRRQAIPVSKTLPTLLASVALLAITDEASVGLVGLALGASWLVLPDVVAPKRRWGVVIFLALAAAVIVPNYLFAAALAHGGPVTSVELVAARVPGFVNGVLPFATNKAVLFSDGFPMLAGTLGLFALLLVAPSRTLAAMFAFAATLTALALFSLLRVEVNHDADESQRFMTAAFFVVPLLGLLSIERAPGSAGALIVFASVLFPAFATVVWLRDGPAHDPTGLDPNSRYMPPHLAPETLYDIDCRTLTGARFGERPRPTYIETQWSFVYSGCRPVFESGQLPAAVMSRWALRVRPALGVGALSQLRVDGALGPNDSVHAHCPRDGIAMDAVCARISDTPTCRGEGTALFDCILTPSDIATLTNLPR